MINCNNHSNYLDIVLFVLIDCRLKLSYAHKIN